MVDIDANNVRPTDAWPGGHFASYHAYPYYPDFYHFEAGLAKFEYQGGPDPYAGYLSALRDHHEGMPVVITEFGVPAGMGLARDDPRGRHQGNHSEQEQMQINAEMLAMIHDLDLAGGFVFEWMDEWFKLTWNTVDYELPSGPTTDVVQPLDERVEFRCHCRRSGGSKTVVVDGDDSEWSTNGSEVIQQGDALVREVRATHDEGFLYLRLEFGDDAGWPTTSSRSVSTSSMGPSAGGPAASRRTGGLCGRARPRRPGPHGGPVGDRSLPGPVRSRPRVLRSDRGRGVRATDVGTSSACWCVARWRCRPRASCTTRSRTRSADSGGERRIRTTQTSTLEWLGDRWGTPSRCACRTCRSVSVTRSSLQAYAVDADGVVTTETVERVGISVAVGDEITVTEGYRGNRGTVVGWQDRPKAGIDVLADQLWAVIEG